MKKHWILPILAFVLCISAGLRIRQYSLPSSGTHLPASTRVVLTLVTDIARDRPSRLELDGTFLMSVNAWRRGVSNAKSHLVAAIAAGQGVRCDDEVACQWLGQRGKSTGTDDADVIVMSSSTWPDEGTADTPESTQSSDEMHIVVPMRSSRKHGFVAGQVTLAGTPINLTSASTRRDCLLAADDLNDLIRVPLMKKSVKNLRVLQQVNRRADQLAVDLEYADASSILQSILKYGGLGCLLFAMFGRAIPVRILLMCICGVVIASASSTFSFVFAPNVLGYVAGPIIGVTVCALGWKFTSNNLAGLLLACLLGDLFTGGYLGSFSGLGANPVLGARYYGVGNELSALLFGCVLANSDFHSFLKITAVGATAILIGHPMLGANGGDMVAVVAGIVVFTCLTGNRKWIAVVLAMLTAAILVIMWDAYFAPSSMQSHLGRLVSTAGSGVPELLASKAFAHIRLMATSVWGVTALISIGWWWLRFTGRHKNSPDLAECIALTLFLLNDSGPVSITLFTLVAVSCDNALAPKSAWSWITKHADALRPK